MRDIKFRAWDGKDMTRDFFVESFGQPYREENPASSNSVRVELGERTHDFYDDWAKIVPKDNFILMQYTGLKDKNGKEIYEGDIIRFWDEAKSLPPREVMWDRFMGVSGWYTTGGHGIPQDNQSNPIMVVIGNIYESPELLEAEQ